MVKKDTSSKVNNLAKGRVYEKVVINGGNQ